MSAGLCPFWRLRGELFPGLFQRLEVPVFLGWWPLPPSSDRSPREFRKGWRSWVGSEYSCFALNIHEVPEASNVQDTSNIHETQEALNLQSAAHWWRPPDRSAPYLPVKPGSRQAHCTPVGSHDLSRGNGRQEGGTMVSRNVGPALSFQELVFLIWKLIDPITFSAIISVWEFECCLITRYLKYSSLTNLAMHHIYVHWDFYYYEKWTLTKWCYIITSGLTVLCMSWKFNWICWFISNSIPGIFFL